MASRAMEVESCDGNYISILQFMQQNEKNIEINAFYTEWVDILKKREISEIIRKKCDDWFTKCKSSNDVHRNNQQMSENQVEMLYTEFIECLSSLKENPSLEFCDKLSLETAKNNIQEKYTPVDWIRNTVACIEHEQNLIRKYLRMNNQDVDQEANKQMDDAVMNIEDAQKEIEGQQQHFESVLEDWEALYEELENKQGYRKEWGIVLDTLQEEKKNGKKMQQSRDHMKTIEITLQEKKPELDRKLQKIGILRQTLIGQYQTIITSLHELVQKLVQEVNHWQTEFKHQYIEIYAQPNLGRIASWCARVGRVLYQLRNTDLCGWNNLLSRLGQHSVQVEDDSNVLQLANTNLQILWNEIIKRTFIVTEQDNYIVKVDKKHNIPKMTVRILAADSLPLKGETVEAFFVLETDINACLSYDNSPEYAKIKDKSKKMVPNTVNFSSTKGKYEGSFLKLKLDKFERTNSGNKTLVHEEKYRVLFTTCVENECLWTLSLPLVVTTGANQGCCALASVMWQCFSTDPYQLPIEIKPTLPWSKVAQMLDAKIQKLCPTRNLTEDNIAHLKNRLLGPNNAAVEEDQEVELNLFCFEKMLQPDKDDTCSFSFWKWFLANYNLLDKYLKDYWKDGLIDGFNSRQVVEQNLKQCTSSGTFLLRFSDTQIEDSQGVSSVFGYITGCVMTSKGVLHVSCLGHKEFERKNLATHLEHTHDKKGNLIFKYIYPGDRKREDTFDRYSKSGTTVNGYVGIVDASIIDLEQIMCDLLKRKHRSPSSDSGFDPASPMSVCSQGGGKRQRHTVGDSCPTLVNILQTSASGHQREPLHTQARPSDTWSVSNSPAHSMGSPSGLDPNNSLNGNPNMNHNFANQYGRNVLEVNTRNSGNIFGNSNGGMNPAVPTMIQEMNLNTGMSPSNSGVPSPASFVSVASPSNNGIQMQYSANQQAEQDILVVPSSNQTLSQAQQLIAMMTHLQVNDPDKFATLWNSYVQQQAQTDQQMPNLTSPVSQMPNMASLASQMPNITSPACQMPNITSPACQMPNMASPACQMPNITSPASQLSNIGSPQMVVTEMDNMPADIFTSGSGSGSGGLSFFLSDGVPEMNSGDIARDMPVFDNVM